MIPAKIIELTNQTYRPSMAILLNKDVIIKPTVATIRCLFLIRNRLAKTLHVILLCIVILAIRKKKREIRVGWSCVTPYMVLPPLTSNLNRHIFQSRGDGDRTLINDDPICIGFVHD